MHEETLTSRGGDRTPEGNKRGDVRVEYIVKLLNKLPANSRVTTDEGVEADKHGTTNPCLGHTRGTEGVR